MLNVTLKLEGFDSLQKGLSEYPDISKKRINDALKAGIFEIQKRTDDSGDSGLFNFKTPRQFRSGYLARSFIFGITFGDLYASIGPTAGYAEYVYNGARGSGDNHYLDRIASAASPDINTHFQEAGDLILRDVSSK